MARCRETAGLLFSHPCKEDAAQNCARCQKPICPKHLRPWQGQNYCIGCHKEAQRQSGQTGGSLEDPYYYSSFYYSDYDDFGRYDRFSASDRDAFASDSAGWSETWSDDWEGDFDAS
ncbi:MAG: hypothetical protein HY319_32270 [Armatimonadetes bacterium]|nr:hypothetical protein [Armatimonadota bacterium]